MILKIIILVIFLLCYLCYLLFEFEMKTNFFEKIHLNFTFNDYADYVFKLLVFNESNQTIHSSLNFYLNLNTINTRNFDFLNKNIKQTTFF